MTKRTRAANAAALPIEKRISTDAAASAAAILAASRAFDHNDAYRALEIVEHVPAGCIGVVVTSDAFDPHLRHGEIAIVDTSDKAPQFGELYAITLCEGTPRASTAIVQLVSEDEVGLWYGFALKGRGSVVIDGRRLRYTDGPLRPDYWPEKCLGRIVGAMRPAWQAGH